MRGLGRKGDDVEPLGRSLGELALVQPGSSRVRRRATPAGERVLLPVLLYCNYRTILCTVRSQSHLKQEPRPPLIRR